MSADPRRSARKKVGPRSSTAPPTRLTQYSSRTVFHTPESKNLRVRIPMGWWLPGWKHLRWSIFLVGCFYLWEHRGRSLTMNANDKATLSMGESLAALDPSFDLIPSSESFDKRVDWGGTLRMEYAYESSAPNAPGLSLICWVDDTEPEALDRFSLMQVKTMIDWDLGGDLPVGLVVLDENDPWANGSRVYRVELYGRAIGFSICLQEGNRVLHAKLHGVEMSKAELRSVLTETMAKLARCEKPTPVI